MALYSENVQRITEDPSVLSVVPPASSNQTLALEIGGVAQSYSLEQAQGGVVSSSRIEPVVEAKEVPLEGPPGKGSLEL